MPPFDDGSSSGEMFQSYVVDSSSVNAHEVGSKHAPPPSRNSTTRAGSASRTQKLNSVPSAHAQSPPGTTFSHTASVATVSVAGNVAPAGPAVTVDASSVTGGSLVGGELAAPAPAVAVPR